MSDKHFVGLDLVSFEDRKQMRPVSRVTFLVDDENTITAGDDTGMEITANNPHATQAMAEAVLARLKGYRYHAFEAGSANLDPAAELGDGITAGGVYGFIGRMNDDGNGYPGVDAPGEAELEDEYPSSEGPMTRSFNRKIAETRSSITKTAEQIRLEVANEMRGMSASFTVQLDSITSRIDGLGGQMSSITQTVDGITQQVQGLGGQMSSIEQYVDSLTLSVTNGLTSSTISLKAGDTTISSKNITFSGFVTFAGLSGGTTIVDGACVKTGKIDAERLNLTGAIGFGDLTSSVQNTISAASTSASSALSAANSAKGVIDKWSYSYRGTTYIDGSMLMTGTVIASKLIGGEVSLLSSNESVAGVISIANAATADYAVELASRSGLRILAQNGGIYINASKGEAIRMYDGRVQAEGLSLVPLAGIMTLGESGKLWSAVYASNGTIQTSDANKKNSIEPLPDKYLDMLDRIKPRRYRMNDGQSGRYHVGFIAQEVEAAMQAAGIDPMEFGGFVKDKDEDGNGIYMLRYDEFTGLLLAKIRRMEEKINGLEAAI